MADSKITALTAISTVDPTADPLVIVDVSDTSMAASGTTKKSTINQLLGAGGTATLASATITGDLTVDTSTLKVDSANNRVGVLNASPGVAFHIGTTGGTNRFAINTAFTSGGDIQLRRGAFIGFSNAADSGNSEYLFANAGALDFGINGSTAMTLNATGLGVGVTPAAGDGSGVFKAAGTGVGTANTRMGIDTREITSGNAAGIWIGAMNSENTGVIGSRTASGNIAFQTFNGSAWGERMRIDYLGNVGIGVTPSAKLDVQTSAGRFKVQNYGGASVKVSSSGALGYEVSAGNGHQFFIDTTQAMTLDASGRLIINSSTFLPPTLNTNGELNFIATSNTNVRFSYRGTDGVTRVADITLA